jgi:diadenosine tetraphosphate (Ap4A) HIT family hydrolase
MSDCIFCELPEKRVFLRNSLALAIWDAFPVCPQHALVIPRRHARDFFDLSAEELLACNGLLRSARELLVEQDPKIEGFNIGLNVGAVAGQTVFHCHFHLIPRRAGDVPDPRGGVRHLIPGKGYY